MQLYATDLSGGNIALQDASMVEKYEITEDAYSKRDGNVDVLVIAPLADSVRAFKKKMQENPDFVKRQEEEMARWAAAIKVRSSNDLKKCVDRAKMCRPCERRTPWSSGLRWKNSVQGWTLGGSSLRRSGWKE